VAEPGVTTFAMTLSAGVVHGIDNRFFYRHMMPLASVRRRILGRWKGATHMKSLVIPMRTFSPHPQSWPE